MKMCGSWYLIWYFMADCDILPFHMQCIFRWYYIWCLWWWCCRCCSIPFTNHWTCLNPHVNGLWTSNYKHCWIDSLKSHSPEVISMSMQKIQFVDIEYPWFWTNSHVQIDDNWKYISFRCRKIWMESDAHDNCVDEF